MSEPDAFPSYQETARAFDRVAADYDAAYGAPDPARANGDGNAVMAWMRQESLAVLQDVFPPGSRLLELGCGAGEEAVRLAAEGRDILATDISPGMAACTLAKARAAGLSDCVRVVALPAGGIAALRPPEPFDGAYASFGGLNCEPDLSAVASGLARLVRPGGAFVTSVMTRVCAFEIAWYMLHRQPRRALRRLRRGWISAPVAGGEGVQVSVLTRYFTVADMRRAFAPHFTIERVMALPLLLPPPYADPFFRRRATMFARMMPLERYLRQKWPWRNWGDHVVIVLRRSSSIG